MLVKWGFALSKRSTYVAPLAGLTRNLLRIAGNLPSNNCESDIFLTEKHAVAAATTGELNARRVSAKRRESDWLGFAHAPAD